MKSGTIDVPTIDAVHVAAERIGRWVHRTPVFTCRTLDERSGAKLYFKCENFQRTGAFKFRGASNAVRSLGEQQQGCGVVTHSSGNHAAGLALAAKLRGIVAHVVMPHTATPVKRAAVAGYGARLSFCEPTLAAREAMVARIIHETGADLVHPYDDPRVIAGQGTATLELLSQVEDLDLLVAPVGGGGLLSGAAVVTAQCGRAIELVAAEPAGADDAARSFASGRLEPMDHPDTIADGLRTPLCERTFNILRQHVSAVVTVSDCEIIGAMRLVWERMKLIVEPSSSVTLAAVLKDRTRFEGRRVGIFLTGGNVDLERLPWQT